MQEECSNQVRRIVRIIKKELKNVDPAENHLNSKIVVSSQPAISKQVEANNVEQKPILISPRPAPTFLYSATPSYSIKSSGEPLKDFQNKVSIGGVPPVVRQDQENIFLDDALNEKIKSAHDQLQKELEQQISSTQIKAKFFITCKEF